MIFDTDTQLSNWCISETLVTEKPSTEPIFAESVISMESYAIKMNALRLQHRLPDRTTNAFLKFHAEMAGSKKMPRSVRKLNKICTKNNSVVVDVESVDEDLA